MTYGRNAIEHDRRYAEQNKNQQQNIKQLTSESVIFENNDIKLALPLCKHSVLVCNSSTLCGGNKCNEYFFCYIYHVVIPVKTLLYYRLQKIPPPG